MLLNFPNALTCCNLICGCMATGAAFHGHFTWALAMIVAGAVFDFFDGMAARALGISSPIGKELDSLADVVTFGVAPSAMLFQLFGMVQYPVWMQSLAPYLPYTAFLMAAFSALRLAKFNLDTRQATSFIGLPTPANALFWSALIVGELPFLCSPRFNALFLFLFMLAFSFFLIAEVPLFALKFKSLSWADNKVKYIFLLGSVAFLPLGITAIPCIILWYIVLSLVAWKIK
ncbi:MAG: CDP-diacylglycerol--serine O-phosphatidyltransferase [Bacteroidaceae bacterium]|nr:CDP-diacylglycerol--serine O-phosphatidyltransferase [Bacteroidaceae bacterium]